MPHTSIRLSNELLDELDDEADEHGVPRSEHIRNTLKERHELAELRQENERLRRKLQAANTRQDDVTELVKYVERERVVQQRREERRHSNIFRRAWWYLAGTPSEDGIEA